VTAGRWDLLIAGGGLGGVAAALAAARVGRRTLLVSEHDWLGGQLTTQGVPPDEHRWIETLGATASYRALRAAIRDRYRTHVPLTDAARSDRYLNPGNAWVSRLAHEPRVAAAVIDDLLAPHVASGAVTVWRGARVVAVTRDGARVTGARVELRDGTTRDLEPRFVLDATETGDLLALADADYVVGAESRAETGEPHAPDGPAQPLNQQAITVAFAIERRPGEDHTIDRPRDYARWRAYQPAFWPGPLLGFQQLDPMTMQPTLGRLFDPSMDDPQFDRPLGRSNRNGYVLWSYRRIVAQRHRSRPTPEVTMAIWPQNDYWLGPIVDVPELDRSRHLEEAKGLSTSLLYWLQTEAPRPDGGTGYPELRLHRETFGTPDGLAIEPYVRESRRIRARFTVREQDLAFAVRGAHGAVRYPDSVGIGMYRIDLHPSTGGDSYIDLTTCPFQIPLGALVPEVLENLLPAAKNIGTTHITNGAYRLHPVEWNVGEVAALLADRCLARGLTPQALHEDAREVAGLQAQLVQHGIELEWPAIEAY
jgi:2-polyprenyl-6-methoxyphenol hydroxylase-like FAD-dependent oxidoreductase